MSENKYCLAGVMGMPVAHSRSPRLHNYWIAHYRLQGSYVLLPVLPENLQAALLGLPALGFAGCNVTLPHKVNVMALVHELDSSARSIGAVNTIVVGPGGLLKGMNNDGFGYVQSLLDADPGWRADAGPIVVLGAGGAARAVLVALAQRGAKEIRLVNRSPEKAIGLAAEFGAPIRAFPWAARHDALADVALLVNTTSQGMQGNPPLDLDLGALPLRALVSDVVYVPLETPLLAQARARGHRTVNGLGMLMNQARPAFQAWFGVLPEITPELRALMERSV